MSEEMRYYTVEGLSGGFKDYKKKHSNILDAVQDYIEHGYCDFYDKDYSKYGDIYLHIFVSENIENVIKLT